MAELQAQIASLRENMEAETLSKVDLQNNIQSLREELAFRKKIYEEVGSLSLSLSSVSERGEYCGQPVSNPLCNRSWPVSTPSWRRRRWRVWTLATCLTPDWRQPSRN